MHPEPRRPRAERGALAAWDGVVLLATVFAAGHAPLYAVLPHPPAWTLVLDGWATVLFAADLVLRFRRPVRVDGRPVTDRRVLARRYLAGWFALDLVSTVPFGLLSLLPAVAGTPWQRGLVLLGLTRALRLARLARLQAEWRTQTLVHPAVFRLGFFSVWAALLAHGIACGWIALDGGGASHADVPPYLRALYWTTTTLATVGYGDVTPVGPRQVAYATAVMVLGAAMFGYLIGNVATLLANADGLRALHLARVERAVLSLRGHGVPYALVERVRDYYDYLWESRRGADQRLFEDLPPSLQIEVALELNRPILERASRRSATGTTSASSRC